MCLLPHNETRQGLYLSEAQLSGRGKSSSSACGHTIILTVQQRKGHLKHRCYQTRKYSDEVQLHCITSNTVTMAGCHQLQSISFPFLLVSEIPFLLLAPNLVTSSLQEQSDQQTPLTENHVPPLHSQKATGSVASAIARPRSREGTERFFLAALCV